MIAPLIPYIQVPELVLIPRGYFDGFPPVGPGEPLIVDRRDPILRSRVFQVG